MFKEFAVEPELLSTWPGYCSLMGHFGINHGRMISKFPKKWKRLVIEAAQKGNDKEFLRIIESLENADAIFVKKGRPWDKAKNWLENAIVEHARLPFHAVLSNQESDGNDFVLNFPELDPLAPPLAWAVISSVSICRTATEMAACIKVMLARCSFVRFVDPYYDPQTRRFNQPLKEFLKAIQTRSSSSDLPIVEYHTGNRNCDLAAIQSDLERWVQPSLAKGQEFQLVRWEQDELHNRFVITDLGAVKFGQGLDENVNDPSAKDRVSIQGTASHLELLEDYSPSSKRFSWLGETLSVIGQ